MNAFVQYFINLKKLPWSHIVVVDTFLTPPKENFYFKQDLLTLNVLYVFKAKYSLL